MKDGFADYETLRVTLVGAAVELMLDRPARHNALTHRMMEELGDVVRRVATRADVRVLVIRGAGGNFSAGGDIGFMTEIPAPPAAGATDPLIAPYRYLGVVLGALDRLPQAVVALVEGLAVGGGFGMACCADVVIAERGATFGMPEPRYGFIPSQIIPFVVRRIGIARARELAVTGGVLRGEGALEAGIAGRLVDGEAALLAARDQVVGEVLRCEPGAVAEVKRLVLDCAPVADARALDDAAESLVRLLRRAEAREGMAAFHEKRPPAWAREGPPAPAREGERRE